MEKLKLAGLVIVVIAVIIVILALIVYAVTQIRADINKPDYFGLVIDSAWLVMLVSILLKAAYLWYSK